MNILLNRKNYRESIGEFITAFAQIELYITLYDAIIKTKETSNVKLAISFSVPLNRKLTNIDTFINHISNDEFYKGWKEIRKEIKDLNLNRNHIIHGTGFSSFWADDAKTMIDEEKNREKLAFKNFSVNDIKLLSDRTYHVLTGINGIQGYFLQNFLTFSRNYFSKQKSI